VKVWLKCLRLPICILASLLVIASFRVVTKEIPWQAVLATFFITSATILQNDWRDRFHDARKGKMLALQHQKAFITWTITYWAMSGGLIVLAVLHDHAIGVVLALTAIVGLVYSETRKIPLVPIMLVSLCSATAVTLPIVVGGNSEKLWLMSLSVFCIIFAREIMKDLEDAYLDRGYKWTFPLRIGERHSKTLATVTPVMGSAVAIKVSLAALLGVPFILVAAILLVRGGGPSTSKMVLDAGMTLIILALITFG